eukprot:gene29370-51354_t
MNGLRVSEATGANIEQLGMERGHRTLTVLRKGGKTVTMPMSPRTARAVDLAVGERFEGPILLGNDGERLDRHAAARIVRRIGKAAGINKKIGPHTLRHGFITAALDAGVPLRDVQEAASHADPRTTMRYDRARVSLDRHATYIVSTFIAAEFGDGLLNRTLDPERGLVRRTTATDLIELAEDAHEVRPPIEGQPGALLPHLQQLVGQPRLTLEQVQPAM